MKVSRLILLGAAGIAGAGAMAYRNTFAAPFVFDDGPSILDNPTIPALCPLWAAVAARRLWCCGRCTRSERSRSRM